MKYSDINYLSEEYAELNSDFLRGRGVETGKVIALNAASRRDVTAILGDVARMTGKPVNRFSDSIKTESDLSLLFAGAKKNRGILLFDEADALFGKRTEVKDAHDRYANIEVSYLARAIEGHDGIVIIASRKSKLANQVLLTVTDYLIQFPMVPTWLRKIRVRLTR